METDHSKERTQPRTRPPRPQSIPPVLVETNNPASAGPGHTKVRSNTPENSSGHINPSSAEDTNTTPGTAPQK